MTNKKTSTITDKKEQHQLTTNKSNETTQTMTNKTASTITDKKNNNN